MNIELFNFSKRINSTKQPATSGTVKTVSLKAPTNMYNPVLTISGNEFNYNYAKFNGNYYYINEIVSVRDGITELHLQIDVLASLKTYINATNAFILYDTTSNSDIVDSRLATVSNASYSENSVGIGWTISEYGGRYVCVTGESSSGCFAVSSGDEQDLLDGFLTWYSNNQATDFSTFCKNLMGSGNINQCVKSCYAIPITTPSGVLGSATTIKLGIYDTGITGYPINNPVATTTFSINIPWQATGWRRQPPYHQVYLYLPFIGTINLSAANLTSVSSLSVTYSCNFMSGSLSVSVSGGGSVIGVYGANIGYSIPIGSSNLDAKSMLSSIITGAGLAAAGAVSGGFGAIAGAAAMASVAMKGLEPFSSTVGGAGGGSGAGLSKVARCYTIYHNTNVTPSSVSTVMGTPACEVKSLGSLSGYIQTDNASVAAPYSNEIITSVNNLLNSGVYLE